MRTMRDLLEEHELAAAIEGLTEAEADAIDEKLGIEQRARKELYKLGMGEVERMRAREQGDMIAAMKKVSTKSLMLMLKHKGEGGLGERARQAAMTILKGRIARSRKTGQLRLRRK